MKVYLVGGAVRDKLLKLPVKEQDWVVVGSTPEALLKAGYQQVGRDFPVFLHPNTKEEYALARTERKSGTGYRGFVCDANPSVTLEEDLARRDLTINAMAEDEKGELIDPYHGLADLKAKTLKHVSPAFVEDPVRVLRVARFAACFKALGFTVAKATQDLMQEMVKSGELAHLVPERVWQEFEKSLTSENPQVFIEVLQAIGAIDIVFPEIEAADLAALTSAVMRSQLASIRFAALMSSLSEVDVKAFCGRLRVPNAYRDLAVLAGLFRAYLKQKDAASIVQGLERVDAFRKPERFLDLLMVYDTGTIASIPWEAALNAAVAINVRQLVHQGLKGEAIKEAIHKARVKAVQAVLTQMDNT